MNPTADPKITPSDRSARPAAAAHHAIAENGDDLRDREPSGRGSAPAREQVRRRPHDDVHQHRDPEEEQYAGLSKAGEEVGHVGGSVKVADADV
jgi:hypothetical protein